MLFMDYEPFTPIPNADRQVKPWGVFALEVARLRCIAVNSAHTAAISLADRKRVGPSQGDREACLGKAFDSAIDQYRHAARHRKTT